MKSSSWIAVFVTLFSCSLPLAALELSKYPVVLVGEMGLEAVVAPTADEEQALVRISGLNHAIDGVVFLADIEKRDNEGRAYRAEIDGQQRSLVVRTRSWSHMNYRSYIPGENDPRELAVDEEALKDFDTKSLLAEYESQKEDGVQAKLAEFDRENAVRNHQEALQKKDESANTACGTTVTTRVDWSEFSDDQLKTLSIAGYCGQVADEMDYMCRRNEAIKEDVAEISEVTCAFTDELKLRQQGSTLVLTTTQDEPNQEEFIRSFLRNL